jgi:type IV secretory pathway VirB10-like protein
MVNVGRGTIKRADVVIERGLPELAAAVDAGEVAVSAAAEVAKLPREEQAAVVAAGPKAVKAKAKEARDETKAAKKAKAPPAPPPPPRVYDELNRRINHAATLGELDEAMTALRRANDDSTLSEGEHSSLLAGYKARHAELRAEAGKAENNNAEADVAALANKIHTIITKLPTNKTTKVLTFTQHLKNNQ